MTYFEDIPFDCELLKCSDNSIEKYRVNSKEITNVLNFFKNNPQFDCDRLNTIIAIDLKDSFELIYDLNSTLLDENRRISVILDKNSPQIQTAIDIYKSAYFDECEIFDLFGINFLNNKKLKRLFMPKGWLGHPLRKDYVFNDKRLNWSVDEQ